MRGGRGTGRGRREGAAAAAAPDRPRAWTALPPGARAAALSARPAARSPARVAGSPDAPFGPPLAPCHPAAHPLASLGRHSALAACRCGPSITRPPLRLHAPRPAAGGDCPAGEPSPPTLFGGGAPTSACSARAAACECPALPARRPGQRAAPRRPSSPGRRRSAPGAHPLRRALAPQACPPRSRSLRRGLRACAAASAIYAPGASLRPPFAAASPPAFPDSLSLLYLRSTTMASAPAAQLQKTGQRRSLPAIPTNEKIVPPMSASPTSSSAFVPAPMPAARSKSIISFCGRPRAWTSTCSS